MFVKEYESTVLHESPLLEAETIHESPSPNTAESVFHAYASRLVRVARGILGNDTDAEDVAQEVLLQVIRKLDSFRGDCDLSTWLHRITVNAALQHRRKQQRRQERQVATPLDVLLNGEQYTCATRLPTPPDRELLQGEMRGLIDAAIVKLPDVYREAYVLADVEGLRNDEIARALGLTLPAIKSRLHRARQLMRKHLEPHFSRPS